MRRTIKLKKGTKILVWVKDDRVTVYRFRPDEDARSDIQVFREDEARK